ncbi:hypothetical protein [Sphingopyxis macrogoltabida]|uniref:hypothetical protein n=1 Tax=Sphingopyxis macrogoltabida TaxID=33050 RepID=UPI000A912E7E|nr:hypothetical protein [Sphingopyxis macrogoltabida]
MSRFNCSRYAFNPLSHDRMVRESALFAFQNFRRTIEEDRTEDSLEEQGAADFR